MHSALLAASENLYWPMPVDYAVASREHRNAFEGAFRSQLEFQTMLVFLLAPLAPSLSTSPQWREITSR
jgi:hypothetical protein